MLGSIGLTWTGTSAVANLRKGLLIGFFGLAVALLFVLSGVPSPWNLVLMWADLAILSAVCYLGEEPGAPRKIHEPRVYYLMTAVVLAALAFAVLFGGLAFERGGWLTVLAIFGFALCVPLGVYIMVAFVLPEDTSGVQKSE